MLTRRDFLKVGMATATSLTLSQAILSTYALSNPYGPNTIPIAPALIVPDCSIAQYLSATGRQRTTLGQQRESELGSFVDEWSDTYETVLLPNPNYSPVIGKAYFRAKYSEDRFYAAGIWPNKSVIHPRDMINISFDTRNLGGSVPQNDHLGFSIGYDKTGTKRGSIFYGNGRDYDDSDMPSDVEWSCDLTKILSYGEALIFKLDAPKRLINPSNFGLLKMAVAIGNKGPYLWFTAPQDEKHNVPSTWGDGLHLSDSQAVPEFPAGLSSLTLASILSGTLLYLRYRRARDKPSF